MQALIKVKVKPPPHLGLNVNEIPAEFTNNLLLSVYVAGVWARCPRQGRVIRRKEGGAAGSVASVGREQEGAVASCKCSG